MPAEWFMSERLMSEGKWIAAGGKAGQGTAIENPQTNGKIQILKDIKQKYPTEKEIKGLINFQMGLRFTHTQIKTIKHYFKHPWEVW